MATNAKAAETKPTDPTVPQNSKKKLIIIVGVVAAVAIAAGAAWFLTKGKGGDHQTTEVKVEPPKKAISLPIESILVNLKKESPESYDQVLQIGISLKFFAPTLEAQIKDNQAELRAKVLLLLTTKTAKELLSVEGKNKLIKEIISMSNVILAIVEAPPSMKLVPATAAPAHGTEAPPEATPVTTPEPTSDTPPAAPAMVSVAVPLAPHEKNGIVDVLFTSFIIQQL